jgi:zinc transport system ATP-binding protein
MLLHINYTSQAATSSACVQESCAVLKLNPLVSIENAGVYRNGKWLVRGVGFSIAPAEIVTLIGPNGSGKSTTAKAILGICDLDEGKRTQNNDLRIGYVPQKIEIDWTLPLTVERFMSITARLSRSEIDENLKRTSVDHLKKSQLRNLSGGELQRVLLARAIARKPELPVLDEPVQGVDFAGEISLYDLISEIRDELQCGILMISHDLHVVMAATDRVICLNGHVCCQGTPDAVAESLEYKHLFGERAVGSLAVYQHQHDHQHLADGTVLHADGSITEHCHPDDGHHHGEHNHGEDKEDQPNV